MRATIKRLLALILALSMCLSLLSVSVWASVASEAAEESGPGAESSVTEQAEPEGSASAAEDQSEAEEVVSKADESEAEEDKSQPDASASAPEEEPEEEVNPEEAPEEESEPEGNPEEAPEEESEEEVNPEEAPEDESAPEEALEVQAEEVSYQEASWNSSSRTVTYTKRTIDSADCTIVTSSTKDWDTGTYIVNSQVTVNDRIKVAENANVVLILCDGAKLTANKGITVPHYNTKKTDVCATLTIYAQEQGTGELVANGNKSQSSNNPWAAIGGTSSGESCGKVIIHGGVITVDATKNGGAAGIGGGGDMYYKDKGTNGGEVTVYGGTVTAKGYEGAGIGAGYASISTTSDGGSLTVYGGEVTATGGKGGAGIGGYQHDGATVEIYGGSVTATGSTYSYGGTSKTSPGIGKGAYFSSTGGGTGSDGTLKIGKGMHLKVGGTAVSGYPATSDQNFSGTRGKEMFVGIPLNTVTFNSNGGTGTMTEQKIAQGQSGKLKKNIFTREKYDFKGWNTDKDGASTGTAYTDEATITPSGDVTLYAQWEPVHEHVFTYAQGETEDTIVATCTGTFGTCSLTDKKATLTIAAPTEGGSAAAVTVTPEGAFGETLPAVQYAKRQQDGSWATPSATIPSEKGFYKTSITLGTDTNTATASAVYGVNCINKDESFDAATAHGDFTVPALAAVGATITPTITPDEGYELDTLTVVKTSDSTASLTVTNNSFVMIDEEVTVNATFKAIDYHLTLTAPQHGTVTVTDSASQPVTDQTVLHIGDKLTLTVAPDEDYALAALTPSAGTLVQDTGDGQTGAGTFTLTMPAADVSLTASFDTMTTYTVFYCPGTQAQAVGCRFTPDADALSMTENARYGSVACYAGRFTGAKGRASFAIGFQEDSGNWSDQNQWPVVDSLAAPLNASEAVVVEGEQDACIIAFLWGEAQKAADGTYTIPAGEGVCYFVTPNAVSMNLPAVPSRDGFTFGGWEYVTSPESGNPQRKVTGENDQTLSLTDITANTTVIALWNQIQATVSFDLMGGSWSHGESVTLNYGEKVDGETPKKDHYVFDGWIVKQAATARVAKGDGTIDKYLAVGSRFDPATVQILEDITLKARWKHVHAYARLQLDDAALGTSFREYQDKKAAYHVKICTMKDDYELEAHSFDSSGKCACGYRKPAEQVTLKSDSGYGRGMVTSKRDKGSTVTLTACAYHNNGLSPFERWEYRHKDTERWDVLTTERTATFAMDQEMQVRAVYDTLISTNQYLKVSSRKLGESKLMFQVSYFVPDEWTVDNAGVISGNNSMLRYFKVHTFWGKETSFEEWNEDAIANVGANNLLVKMYMGESISVPGNSLVEGSACKIVGRCGSTTLTYSFTGEGIDKDKLYYGIAYLQAKDPLGQIHHYFVGPIKASYNNPNAEELFQGGD